MNPTAIAAILLTTAALLPAASACPLDTVYAIESLVNYTVNGIVNSPIPLPAPACVGGYNPAAYTNVCYEFFSIDNSTILCSVPPCLVVVVSGSLCPIGNICTPLPAANLQGNPFVELRVEVACNQPNIPCLCDPLPAGLPSVIICSPFT